LKKKNANLAYTVDLFQSTFTAKILCYRSANEILNNYQVVFFFGRKLQALISFVLFFFSGAFELDVNTNVHINASASLLFKIKAA